MMKKLMLSLALAVALPAIAAEADPNPNRLQSDSIDKPVLDMPRAPAMQTEPRVQAGSTRAPERTDGEPPAGDTKPGGPSAAVQPRVEPLPASPSEPGSPNASTRAKAMSD
jgi:hypothetical protein